MASRGPPEASRFPHLQNLNPLLDEGHKQVAFGTVVDGDGGAVTELDIDAVPIDELIICTEQYVNLIRRLVATPTASQSKRRLHRLHSNPSNNLRDGPAFSRCGAPACHDAGEGPDYYSSPGRKEMRGPLCMSIDAGGQQAMATQTTLADHGWFGVRHAACCRARTQASLLVLTSVRPDMMLCASCDTAKLNLLSEPSTPVSTLVTEQRLGGDVLGCPVTGLSGAPPRGSLANAGLLAVRGIEGMRVTACVCEGRTACRVLHGTESPLRAHACICVRACDTPTPTRPG